MAISAYDSPLLTYPVPATPAGVPIYYGGASQNPEAGPSSFMHGVAMLDGRAPFTYNPGQNFGAPTYMWCATGSVPLIDQVPSAIAANNLATSQSPGAGAITLTAGTGITGSVSITNALTGQTVSGLFAIDGAMGAVTFGSAATLHAWDPTKALARTVRITSGGNDSGINFTVNGYDLFGYPMTQTLAGSSGAPGTVSTTKAFKYVSSVTHSGSVAGTVTIGTGDTYGFPWQMLRSTFSDIFWGTPQTYLNSGSIANQTTLEIPVTLSALANAQQYQLDVPFDGTLVSMNLRVTAAGTGSGATATLTAQANASSVTGGVVVPTLANTNAIGNLVSGTAITGNNTFTAGQTVGFVVSSVTSFTGGTAVVELVVQNSDASGGTFTAPYTGTSSATTGDVRGTIAVPSASDGTKRLTVFGTLLPSQVGSQFGTASIYGVPQA